VAPGVCRDRLNESLKERGVWFPVDVSTSAQATLGGMAGNNSCGSRSIRYGKMGHNVPGIYAVLADGSGLHFGAVNSSDVTGSPRYVDLARKIAAIAAREADEIAL